MRRVLFSSTAASQLVGEPRLSWAHVPALRLEPVVMHLVQILLPVTDNSGQPFAREEFDRIKNELAREHGGVTAYLQSPAEGLWQQAGDIDKDEVVILEVMAKEIDLPRWQKRRAELERRFRQDEVIIRYLPAALI